MPGCSSGKERGGMGGGCGGWEDRMVLSKEPPSQGRAPRCAQGRTPGAREGRPPGGQRPLPCRSPGWLRADRLRAARLAGRPGGGGPHTQSGWAQAVASRCWWSQCVWGLWRRIQHSGGRGSLRSLWEALPHPAGLAVWAGGGLKRPGTPCAAHQALLLLHPEPHPTSFLGRTRGNRGLHSLPLSLLLLLSPRLHS